MPEAAAGAMAAVDLPTPAIEEASLTGNPASELHRHGLVRHQPGVGGGTVGKACQDSALGRLHEAGVPVPIRTTAFNMLLPLAEHTQRRGFTQFST